MNIVRQIALTTLTSAALLSVAHATTGTRNAFNEEVVSMGHSFELNSGQHVLLAHHKAPVPYRVCVEEVPGIVPLEVNVDGKDVEVMDGTCQDIVGAHIIIKPSPKLGKNLAMVGRFERVKK